MKKNPCQRLQLFKLVHCITNEKALLIDADIAIAIASLFAGLPSVGSVMFESAIAEICELYDTVPSCVTPYSDTFSMSSNGELFNLCARADEVFRKIQEVFSSYQVGTLRDNFIHEIMRFIHANQAVIKNLYFDGGPDFLQELEQRKLCYSERHAVIQGRREMLFKKYPSMLYHGIRAAVDVVTTDMTKELNIMNKYVDNNGILNSSTFTIEQFNELHITKILLSMYIDQVCGRSHQRP